jgi:hypothetical protein
MEVHAHTHTARKKWTHYFWEFLMLFLAVFCGFLAEYQLEHKIEKDREKQFMQSLVQDTRKDIEQCDSLYRQHKFSQTLCDSLMIMLAGKEINVNSYPAYELWSSMLGYNDFIPNDGTIQQLKNSGALRLVKKQEVVSRLMDYNKITETIKILQSGMNTYLLQQFKKTELFDAVRFSNANDRTNVSLISNDRKLLSWGYEYISLWKRMLEFLNINIENAKAKGKDLIGSVNKEYHLE